MRKLIVLLCLVSLKVLAIESVDVMPVRLLKIEKDNIVVISRGLEDSLNKGDHIKLTNNEGFIARGVCLSSQATSSYWKVYRVVRPHLMTLDADYDLVSMSQSEMPEDIKAYEDGLKVLKNKNEHVEINSDKKIVPLQQKRIVEFDLPESNEKNPISRQFEQTDSERFMERNFDKKRWNKDLENIQIQLKLAPMMVQSRTNTYQKKYSVGITNDGQKYVFNALYEHESSQVVNQYNNDAIKTSSEVFFSEFDIKRIWSNWSYFAHFSTEANSIGEVSNPSQYYKIGLVGLRYHLFKESSPHILNISYIPVWDDYTFDRIQSDGSYRDKTLTNARHMFMLNWKTKIQQGDFYGHLHWRPYMELNGFVMDATNSKTQMRVTYAKPFYKKLYVEYSYEYQNDIMLKREYDINAENHIHMLNFRLDFGI